MFWSAFFCGNVYKNQDAEALKLSMSSLIDGVVCSHAKAKTLKARSVFTLAGAGENCRRPDEVAPLFRNIKTSRATVVAVSFVAVWLQLVA